MKKIIIITLILVASIGIAKATTIQKEVTVLDETSTLKEGVVEVTKTFVKPDNEIIKYTKAEVETLIRKLEMDIENNSFSISMLEERITELEADNTSYTTKLNKYKGWLALFSKEVIK